MNRNYFWILDSDKAGSSNSDKDIDTDTNAGHDGLLLQVGTKLIFGQGHREHLEF
jgi:hypothetical protein